MRAIFARFRLSLDVRRVRAGLRFGQREGRQLTAIHQFRQPLFLLRLGSEKEQSANPNRVMGVGENRSRSATATDLLEHLAIHHLRKSAAAHFLRRGHAEHADPAETVDHFPRNIRDPVDLRRVEMLIEKLPHFRERPVEFGLLRIGDFRIRHRPIGDEIPEEQALRKAQLLLAGEEQFLGLFDFLLTLNFGFGECHKIRVAGERPAGTAT